MALVVVSSRAIALRTLGQLEAALGPGSSHPERSVAFHARTHLTLRRFFRFAPAHFLGALRIVVSFLVPVLSLLPFGPSGVRHWLARNSLFTAQTLMLAAAARGLDTCPMEGFDAMKVSRVLGLPCGSVVPVVIAVGHQSASARVEPRLRRSLAEAVVVH
ncbi:nitroreductase family protein [Cystobacter fuscus]|uniref:nitroreductase family protein n=1 Tax=Cystobacter fuscus TaxID=43 RepID=UPI0037BF5280